MNENDLNAADSLLQELKNLNKTLKGELKKEQEDLSTFSTVVSTISTTVEPAFKLSEDNLSEFILDNTQKIILNGLKTIDSLKDIIANTADAKSMSGFADIVTATNAAITTLNNINIEKKKAITAKEIKQMDIDGRKQIADTRKPNNTLNIIAPREQIIKMLEEVEKKREEKPTINVEFKDVPPENDK